MKRPATNSSVSSGGYSLPLINWSTSQHPKNEERLAGQSRNSQSNPGARSDPSTEARKLETSYFLEGAKILGICNASCVRRARSSYIGVWHSFLPDGYDSAIRNGWHVNAPPSQNRTMDWCPPDQARSAGFTDWVLAGVRRERIERIARRVYRIPYLPPGRFLLYREALLRANA
jgi:hypothetical protein